MSQGRKIYLNTFIQNHPELNSEDFEEYEIDRYNLTESYPSHYNYEISGKQLSTEFYDYNYSLGPNKRRTFRTYFRPITIDSDLSSYIQSKYCNTQSSNSEYYITICPYCGSENEYIK